MLQKMKKLSFCGSTVRRNMLNMRKSASGFIKRRRRSKVYETEECMLRHETQQATLYMHQYAWKPQETAADHKRVKYLAVNLIFYIVVYSFRRYICIFELARSYGQRIIPYRPIYVCFFTGGQFAKTVSEMPFFGVKCYN